MTEDATTATGRRTRLLRNVYGSSAAESFLVVAIATILITRLYLALTDYPQIGGGTLHIAHALYGGAAMMAALLIGWLFLGFGTRVTTVVVGGIGFGLFLDEVGKFVTRDNDYFYGPAAEIMYVLVVLLLVINRVVRDFRAPTADECLANAAAIAADGVVHGLPPHRRALALRIIERGQRLGADASALAGVTLMIDAAGHRDDRLYAASRLVPRLVPSFLKSPRWVPVMGWLLVVSALLGVIGGIVQLVAGGLDVDTDDTSLQIDRMGISGGILFVSAAVTLSLALPAMLRLRRDGPLWPLRLLRLAALIFTALNALVDFATEGFGALTYVAIGLFTMAVISHRITVRSEELAADEAGARESLPRETPHP
ncbi:hypothetical protein SAMN05444695_104247 [Rhodococcus triatomae]|uniref:Uncharacterized protein n=1 Tax=Rhodococcus triatomae TaxID=300028 RepID=A0A1G8GYE2_9NOCA|nr:hypothetical protein [Rhodococcus triatomae]SDH99435.1 hypothetical protein SAMN05444695_104247 [Rhodococcus triatomae]